MTTVTAEQIAGLVERLREHVRFRYMPAAARLSMDQAAQALTALSDHFADAGKMVTALQERVEGLERELARQVRVGDLIVARADLVAMMDGKAEAEARADALSAELEGLKKGSSSSRDHEHSTCSALELEYAQRLATVAATFYGPPAGWRPLPDLCGVLTQIDNALTGLCRAPSSAEQVVGDSTRDTKNHPSTNGEG